MEPLAIVKFGNPVGLGHSEIAVLTSIIDCVCGFVQLGTLRNLDMKNRFTFIGVLLREKNKGRVQFLGIVRKINKVVRDRIDVLGIDADDMSRIVHAQEDIPAIPVQHGAERALKNAPFVIARRPKADEAIP